MTMFSLLNILDGTFIKVFFLLLKFDTVRFTSFRSEIDFKKNNIKQVMIKQIVFLFISDRTEYFANKLKRVLILRSSFKRRVC